MIKLLTLSGSPVEESSTDLLLQKVAISVERNLPDDETVSSVFIKLNDLEFRSCQSCGEAPASGFCIFDDALTEVYKMLAACDCLLFGSPIYFDSVSAQAKLFIDRCNCIRPADFDNRDPDHDFIKLLSRKRPGGIVLVGGEQGWFEGARRTIAGFFKWVEVVNAGVVSYRSSDLHNKGTVIDSVDAMAEAAQLGRKLADAIRGDS